jgi:lantibiotic transport system permease protein
MKHIFFLSLQSEWLKKKRSLASLMIVGGAFFTPVVIIVVRLFHGATLPKLYTAPNFWIQIWQSSWESMALFLIPLGTIMATSLITQLEYKNNTWKQLHTLPVSLNTFFFSKLIVILVLLLQFLILFNIGIYLAAIVPYLLVCGTPYPTAPIPMRYFLRENVLFFIDCLPIVALQYLLSLKYKNFLLPFGIGFLLWIASIGSLVWKYNYLLPYTHGMLNYLKTQSGGKVVNPEVNFHYVAFGYFIVFTIASYILYVTKKEKG